MRYDDQSDSTDEDRQKLEQSRWDRQTPQCARRGLLKGGGGILATTLLAGCSGLFGDQTTQTPEGDASPTSEEDTPTPTDEAPTQNQPTVDMAVAAEWNAMRARLWDALALGLAGNPEGGATVAQGVLTRFEQSSGEYSAHEKLEHTSKESYEGFEKAVGNLQTNLQDGGIDRARENATAADTHLAEAQRKLVGETMAHVLALQQFGTTIQNAAFLAATRNFSAAQTVATDVLRRFENAAAHDAVEEAAPDAYERFEQAIVAAQKAAKNEDAKAVQSGADKAFSAVIGGSYKVADTEAAAGAGELAALQARGWDAAAVVEMGGTAATFGHAVSLSIYRLRAYDAEWLAAQGETEMAATMANDILVHFEEAKVHEALEEAAPEAYEGFEAGVVDLTEAIKNGATQKIDDAVARIDANLVTAIETLAGAKAPLVEAGFYRGRLGDALELYKIGQHDTAATLAEGLLERFEKDELGFHEAVEHTSEEIYERFEEHLVGLADAFASESDSDVTTHYEEVQSALLNYETSAGTTVTVSGAEAAFMAGRGFDAAVVDALGRNDRAQAIAESLLEHFEKGAGGYHEALEHADETVYESFEHALVAIATAAENDAAVYPKAKTFNGAALESIYAIIEHAGGTTTEVAAAVIQSAFTYFEGARVHELLEHASTDTYEAFETALDEYLSVLKEGGNVEQAAAAFARAALRAQFAVVGALQKGP